MTVDKQGSEGDSPALPDLFLNIKSPAISLILIPLMIYIIWVLDTFLLEGSTGTFTSYHPWSLILYTIIAGIFMGIIVPVFFLKSAFLSGAVNMFQIGFRSLRRTILTVICTALFGYLILIMIPPYNAQKMALVGMTFLVFPSAIASVMVCWVIAGTHLQAYVRNYRTIVSITAGVLATGIMFGLSFAAHSPPLNQPQTLLMVTGAGIASALYFFSVREVWGTSIFVAFALVLVLQGHVDPAYIAPVSPVTAGTAMLSVIALAACRLYLSRRFITIRLPAGFGQKKEK